MITTHYDTDLILNAVMNQHVVFLERDSLKARVRRPDFEHTYEEYAAHPSVIRSCRACDMRLWRLSTRCG